MLRSEQSSARGEAAWQAGRLQSYRSATNVFNRAVAAEGILIDQYPIVVDPSDADTWNSRDQYAVLEDVRDGVWQCSL
jgi:hypothetical protein